MEAVKKPGIAGYIIALIILILGVGGAVAGVFFGVKGIAGMAGKQYVVPGNHEIIIQEAGTYVVFQEATGMSPAGILPVGLNVMLTEKGTGQQIPLDPLSVSVNYNVNNRQGQGVLSFNVDKAGTYVLAASYPSGETGPPTVLTVSKGAAQVLKSVGGMLGGCCILPAAVVAAFVIWLVTFLRRGKAERRQQEQQNVAAPPPPGPVQ